MLQGCLLLTIVLSVPVHHPGDSLWMRRWNGPGEFDDRPSAVLIDSKGNVIVAGFTYSQATDNNFVTIKYDSLGRLLWTRIYGSPLNSEDRIWAASLDSQDNIYVTGGSIVNPEHNWDYVTIKYYPSGDTAWMRRYDSPFHDEDKSAAIAIDDSANVYVTGASRGHKHDWDYLTIKYNRQGDTIWTRRFDGPPGFDDQATALVVDRRGNVTVTGKSMDEDHVPAVVTVKYGPAGGQLWNGMFRGTGNGQNSPTRIVADTVGDLYVCGSASARGSMYDCFLCKYRQDGRYLWSRTYDGPGRRIDIANDMKLDPAGNIIITGQSMGGQTFSDYVTIKYNPSGETLWIRRYDGPVHHEDRAQAMAVDELGDVYVTGGSLQVQPHESYFTIAYSAQGDSLRMRDYRSNGTGNSRATGIAVRFGRVVVTGFSANENNELDIVTIAYRK